MRLDLKIKLIETYLLFLMRLLNGSRIDVCNKLIADRFLVKQRSSAIKKQVHRFQ
jgi:hypothetical protein